METVDRIFFRKINPSDFRNMYEVAKPSGGGGQTYIEAAGIDDDTLFDFLSIAEKSDSTLPNEKRQSFLVNCRVIGSSSKSALIEFSPRTGRNYRICRQNLSNRHPAWRNENGFPEPEKDAAGHYKDSPAFTGIIDNLLIYIVRTNHNKYYAGFLNEASIPVDWPTAIGLENMFKGDRRGVIVFDDVGPEFHPDATVPFVLGSATQGRLVVSGIEDTALQRIVYGAPGTGKSNGVNKIASKLPKENVVRTTFHPDSDYSTFVGAYKPTMVQELEKQENRHLGIDQLADILKNEYEAAGEGSDKGKALAVDLFAEQYYEYLDGRFGKVSLADLLSKAGMPKGYNVGLRDSINVAKYHALKQSGKKHISYEFVPQAFAKAYVQAWKKMAKPEADGTVAPVMLVVEEINRGDCAKIFGDLFQLLDRFVKDDANDPKKKAGFSEYPVLADSDLADYIRRELDAVKNAHVFKDYPFVIAAENLELLLPPNMYIWATMNTSDQSLFPMDSAFKRRWDWKYVPIKNLPEENWKIVIGTEEYSWWDFLKKINKEVRLLTSSEDKQLGYFFVKTPDKIVREDAFVNKVLFFLWNVVWKDCYTECEYLKNGDDYFTFRDFFDDDGKANAVNVNKVLAALKIDKWSAATPTAQTLAPTAETANATTTAGTPAAAQ